MALKYNNGAGVRVKGLANAVRHNGKSGRVIGFNKQTSRYCVKLHVDDKTIAIKEQNLDPDYQSISLSKLLDRLLPCLGGLPKSGVNRIPMDTPYGRLPRLTSLPSVHSKDATFSNEDAKIAFSRIYSGDFNLIWWENGNSLTVKALSDHETDKFHGTMYEMKLVSSESASAVQDNIGAGLRGILRERQWEALRLRVMHHFIRMRGASLDRGSWGSACSYLVQRYAEKEWWVEQLDASMALTDLCFNMGAETMAIERGLTFVGEALECQARFNEAAEIYEQLGKDYCSYRPDKIDAYTNCGLAYKRGKKFDKAEQAYVTAMYLDSTSEHEWDLNRPRTVCLITNMLVMYYSMSRNDGSSGMILNENLQWESILVSLLSLAGFEARQGGLSHTMVLQVGLHARENLKKEFSSRDGAKKALMKAAREPNVASFRSTIMACMAPNYLVMTIADPEEFQGEQRRQKNAARKQVAQESGHNTETLFSCANPNCSNIGLDSNDDFKACPCHVVSYCQKSCQVEHWNVHKKVCPWKKSQKKK